LQPNIGLGQLRNLFQRLAERAPRIVGAVLRLVSRWVRDLQHLYRVERLAAGAVQNAVGGGGVLGLERRPDRVARLARTDPELAQLAHGERRSRSLQHARELLRQGYSTEGCRCLEMPHLQIAVQPTVRRAL